MEGVRSALITGSSGQDGILLAQLLADKGYRVWGMVRKEDHRLHMLREAAPTIQVVIGDIRDRAAVASCIRSAEPDEVYNLAALSSVAQSWERAHEVMEVNAVAVVGLLDEIRTHQAQTGRQVRFYQASSSEMFGAAPETPQNEQTAFHPRSPYGVAKAAAHFLTVNYRESYGMYACSGILYNHESRFREPQFVTRKISRGVAAITTGRLKRLTLGNLEISRDWGFAPDYVEAMWLMLQQDKPEDFVVASGESHTLEEFLSAAFAYVGIEDWSSYIASDPSLFRPAEVVGLVGNASKAYRDLDWRPSVQFADIVRHMVEYDLALVKQEAELRTES